jgi:hypothetical protein
MNNNKIVTELTDIELNQTILNNTINREIISSQLNILITELLRRQQLATQPEQVKAILPTLKKIELPKLHKID